jgi:chromosome segregation ATPase
VYTTVLVIAIVVVVMQYQLASLKEKIADLKTENEALKYSINNENSKLSFSLSDIERSIEIIEHNIDRLKKEDIHDINDNIKSLKAWLRNVGTIAVSAKDKINPSVDN